MNRLAAVVLAVAASACTTTMKVYDISALKDGDHMSGVPFRVRRAYTVRVFARQPDGSYKQVLAQPQDLPDPDRVYAVAAESASQSARTFEVKLRDDSTLDSVHVKSEDKAAETVSAAATQAGAIGDAVASYESKKNEAEIAKLKGELDLAKQKKDLGDFGGAPAAQHEADLVAALVARNAAEAAQRALDALAADATPSQLGDAAATLRLAQLKANQAATKAGLPEPYPGVFP